ncbi:hypothetical protein D3C79_845710 [compost metagenome]
MAVRKAVVTVQIFRLERCAAFGQVRRACAVHPLNGGNASGDQCRVFQCADAQRQVVALTEQIHGTIAQIHLHRHVAIALQKHRQQAAQMRQRERQRRTHTNGPPWLGGLAGDALLHLFDFAEQAQG